MKCPVCGAGLVKQHHQGLVVRGLPKRFHKVIIQNQSFTFIENKQHTYYKCDNGDTILFFSPFEVYFWDMSTFPSTQWTKIDDTEIVVFT